MNKNTSTDKNKSYDKGKARVEEIKEKYKKKWVKKGDSDARNESTPYSGAGTSSGN